MAFSPSISLTAAAAVITVMLFSHPVTSTVTIIARSDPPAADPTFLLPGSGFTLTCTTTKEGRTLSWTWVDLNNIEIEFPKMAVNSGAVITGGNQISFKSVSGKNGGNYTCSDGTDSDTYYANVLDSDSIIPRPVIGNGSETTVLKCDQRFKEPFPVIWILRKDGNETILNDRPDDKVYSIADANKGYALTIKNKDRKRVPDLTGDYLCRLNRTVSSGPFLQKTVQYRTKPDVRIEGASHGKSKSATKDEPFSITCVYSGESPQAHLIWTFSTNDTNGVTILDQRLDDPFRSLLACPGNAEKNCSSSGYVFGRNTKIEQESATSEPGKPEAQNEKTSMLEFSSIQESDRGTYTCSIENEHGRSTASVEVKVKDKLAALWPFLGIVAEVVILCAIIFIYEKRRNKTVDEEDENEPMKEDLNRDSHDAAVRSRK